MKNTKRFFPVFAFYDRTGIEKYLEEKAQNGWLLKKIANFGWVFEKCEPKKIHFCVTYFPKASAFDPEPTEEQIMFTEFCEHTGWVFAAQNAQMQVFYNEEPSPVPIETDALIELENIHKSAKKSFLPTYYIFIVNGILQALSFFTQYSNDPVYVLTSNVSLFNGLCWVLMLVMSFTEIINYFSWRRKATSAAENDGSFMETSSRQGFQFLILAIMLMGFVLMSTSLHNGALMKTLLFTLSGIMAITMLVVFISNSLKKMKVSKSVNGFVTFGGSILFGLLFAVGVVYILASGTGSLGHDPVSTYEYGIFDIEVYNDPIPLKIEDMQEMDYDRFSYEMWHQESFLAEKTDCVQEPHISDSDEISSLRYTVYEVKFFPIYDTLAEMIKNDLLDGYDDNGRKTAELRKIDSAPFYADKAFRMYFLDEPAYRYLIFYDRKIVEIRPYRELSEKDMNIIGTKLGIQEK